MKTGGQLTDRDHGDTIAFLRKHTTARILIVVDAQAVIGTGHPVCSGNRTTGLQGAPLRAVLQWYLGRTAYGLLSHHVKEAQVGLVLLTCGPATHEEASLGEIQGLLAQ